MTKYIPYTPKTNRPIPIEHIEKYITYNPETGDFIHHAASYKTNNRFIGKKAGTINKEGYVIITIKGKGYPAHRIAYFLTHKKDAVFVDHINGNRSDNRAINLRSVDKVSNCRNQRLRKNNSSGFNGVYWYKRTQQWIARIQVNFISIHLGYFDKLEDAITARKKANITYKFHPNHGKEHGTTV